MKRVLGICIVVAAAFAAGLYGSSLSAVGPAAAQTGAVGPCTCSAPTKLQGGGTIYQCACGSLYCAVVSPAQPGLSLACR